MNKLIVALCASAFAFGSASVLADDSDMKPLTKMQTDEAKAARAAAKAKWDKMTPEEQAAYKKQARAKKAADLTALEAVAQESDRYNTKAGAAAAAESKTQPKPTAAQRQQDLNTLEKKAGPSGQ